MSDRAPRYEAERLVENVRLLLNANGVEATLVEGEMSQAISGARTLLQAFGIMPTMGYVESLIQSADKPWVDTDDRRALAPDTADSFRWTPGNQADSSANCP